MSAQLVGRSITNIAQRVLFSLNSLGCDCGFAHGMCAFQLGRDRSPVIFSTSLLLLQKLRWFLGTHTYTRPASHGAVSRSYTKNVQQLLRWRYPSDIFRLSPLPYLLNELLALLAMHFYSILSISLALGVAVGQHHHRLIEDEQPLYARKVDAKPYARGLHAREAHPGYNTEALAKLSGSGDESPVKGEGEQRAHAWVRPILPLGPLPLLPPLFEVVTPSFRSTTDANHHARSLECAESVAVDAARRLETDPVSTGVREDTPSRTASAGLFEELRLGIVSACNYSDWATARYAEDGTAASRVSLYSEWLSFSHWLELPFP